MKKVESQLKGGHPNSLGNTLQVVEDILKNNTPFSDLFACYFSTDEVVRLRVSSAVKRICIARKSLVLPYIDRLLKEVAAINQASTQWTLAQLFDLMAKDMNVEQITQAKEIMKNNLATHDDWIVLSYTMATLAKWSKEDEALKKWMLPHLNRLCLDKRKSVAKRAEKIIASTY